MEWEGIILCGILAIVNFIAGYLFPWPFNVIRKIRQRRKEICPVCGEKEVMIWKVGSIKPTCFDCSDDGRKA